MMPDTMSVPIVAPSGRRQTVAKCNDRDATDLKE